MSETEVVEGELPERSRLSRVLRRAFPWLAIAYAALILFPIHYPITRALMVSGAVALWAIAVVIWWRRRALRVGLIAIAGILVFFLVLPGRAADPEGLRTDYRRALSLFGSARYAWGGETPIGIDCSGFVREGMAGGLLLNGVRTLNGASVRQAVSMWSNDATAKDLRDGAGGRTMQLGEFDSVNAMDQQLLAVGDLAATTDGAHVMVYVGDGTWMEADPLLGRVVTERVPSTIGWFEEPVVLLRWEVLEGSPSGP